MKVKSLYGVDEVVASGKSYPVVDGVADVPDEVAVSLLEQVDAWVSVKADKAAPKEG